MNEEPKAAAQEPAEPPKLPPPVSAKVKARARSLRRGLVALSVGAMLFAAGGFLYRRYQRLPEVVPPAFRCEAVTSPRTRDRAIDEFESDVSNLRGLGSFEIIEGERGVSASLFPVDPARGDELWQGFPLARSPWIKKQRIEQRSRYIAISGGQFSPVERFSLVSLGLNPELSKIPGVRSVELCGGARPETHITFSMDRAGAVGATTKQLVSSVVREPAGVLRAPSTEADDSLKKLLERPVTAEARVRDLARVEVAAAPSHCRAFRGESEDVMIVRVSLAVGADARLEEGVEAYEKKAPPGVHIRLLGYNPKAQSAAHPTQIELHLPGLSRDEAPKVGKKLRALSDEALAYLLAETDGGVEALLNVPPTDGRKPEEYERFMQTELSRAFGCVYSANVPALRVRLSSGPDVLASARQFAETVRSQAGVLAAEVVSPAAPAGYLLQMQRVLQLGLEPTDVHDAFALATEGKDSYGTRVKTDLPLERAFLLGERGARVPLSELFEKDERVRSALRVNRRVHADLCVTSASLSPEELAGKVVPLARKSGFEAHAARWVVR